MRACFLCLSLLFIHLFVFSQTPGVQWSRPIGGTSTDNGRDIQKTSDGGFLLYGTTSSNNVDVSGNDGDSTNLWVVKLNNLGKIQWQKCFGGTGIESASKLFYNPDGTAVLIGQTFSNDGDVSGNHGSQDIWVVKIDESGNILWKKTLGGSGYEGFVDAKLTNDNGYIIAATTDSNDGDAIGNDGGQDVWVLKLSSGGNLEWQKTLGGNMLDWVQSIVQNADGNYVLTGYTPSNNGDFTGNHGGTDIWVVKLTPSGTVVWTKTYGGTSGDSGYDLTMANDGSIAVLGHTSSVNGDVIGKTSSNRDLWVLNLDYSDGHINWQKIIGGSSAEMPYNIFQDADGMFLVSGYTDSNDGDASTNHGGRDILLSRLESTGTINWIKCFGGPSLEEANDIYNDISSKKYVFVAYTRKEGGDVIGYHQNSNFPDTYSDAWLVTVNYDGNIAWQRCLGGTFTDNLYAIKKVSETTYILAGESFSNDGDVLLNRGANDAWVVQIGPVNTIKGTVFIDNNLNGVKDAGELFYSAATVTSKKSIDSVNSVPYNGLFINEVDTGAYVTSLSLNQPYHTIVPSSFSSNFSTYFNTDSFSFALQPIANKKDLSVHIIPLNVPRPGFSSSYRVFYKNEGTTTITTGEILFKKDSRVNLLSASPSVSSTSGDTLKWAYSNFAPGDTASIFISLQVSPPPTANINDTLSFVAIITPVGGDETPLDDTSVVRQRVVGSFDPNDKAENNGGIVSSSFIALGNYLQYTIRFQNMGTAEAYFVIVRDTLSSRLDANSLEIITASHPYSFSIENGNQLIWQFDDIMLSASSVDETGSHGYIVYRIRPKSDVVVGETIHNTASIYFDYNLPVVTNDALILVQDAAPIALPIRLSNFTGALNSNIVQLSWNVGEAINFEKFEVERSLDGINYNTIRVMPFGHSISTYNTHDDISILQSKQVYYRLKLIDRDGKFTYSKVIAFKISLNLQSFVVYPNPARTEVFISLTAHEDKAIKINILDVSGRIISDQRRQVLVGSNVFPLNTSNLKAGNYVLRVMVNGEVKTSKFTIIN